MSMNLIIYYGIGFNCDCDAEKFKEFIKNRASSFCQSDDETERFNHFFEQLDVKDENENPKTFEKSELEDLVESNFESYSCQCSGAQGVGAVISNIMTRETGIWFAYYGADGNCDTYPAVIFQESFPWKHNETEKNLTREKLDSIYKKYMDELGIEGKPDFLKQEYYG